MSDGTPPANPTSAQVAAVVVLRDLASSINELALVAEPTLNGTNMLCPIAIDMSGFTAGHRGLKIKPCERFDLILSEHFPMTPPQVHVAHFRWLGFPHVLSGYRLCLFLDPQREWSPASGVAGALNRLWTWLDDAVAGRTAVTAALHHGFGGVTSYGSASTPILVVGSALGDLRPGIRPINIKERSPSRLDVVASGTTDDTIAGLALVSDQQLPTGLPRTLEQIVFTINRPWWPAPDLRSDSAGFPTEEMLVARLTHLVRDLDPLQRIVLLVAAPNRSIRGSGSYDLMAAQMTAGAVTEALANLSASKSGHEHELEFLRVDDVRPEITERRDDGRPTGWFSGRAVEVWGCGALGSWIAELLVRAGVRSIRIRDYTPVTSGLLVRQNFTNADIGAPKAQVLADRLRLIGPDVDVSVSATVFGIGNDGLVPDCELVIDATASAQVTALLDSFVTEAPPELNFAQVATDNSSATLGIVALTSSMCRPSEVDRQVRDHVLNAPTLEGYRTLWDPDDQLLTPARGCSTPTFRGSAADVMGVASSAVSLLGGLLRSPRPGAQLFALPHSPVATQRLVYVSVEPAG